MSARSMEQVAAMALMLGMEARARSMSPFDMSWSDGVVRRAGGELLIRVVVEGSRLSSGVVLVVLGVV
jgi:hypothetical protein